MSKEQLKEEKAMEKNVLTKLKNANKFKPRQEYFKNAILHCSSNLDFISSSLKEEFTINLMDIPNSVYIYSSYESIYYEKWNMFLPKKHTKLIQKCKLLTCTNVISYIQQSIYPFDQNCIVFIYDIESYFKEQQKYFTQVMKNKQVDLSNVVSKEQLDSWMLGGNLNGIKILLSSKSQLILTIKQYCRLAVYKPYRDVLEGGIGLNRCAELPADIWYRMIENIPRIKKSEIDLFVKEFPSISCFYANMAQYERSCPNEGYLAINSVGNATALRIYNIFMGKDE